jgi:hypothetical protein
MQRPDHDEDEPDPGGADARPDRIPWPNALALLLLGCLALGAAAGFGALGTGFCVAALIEPHDVLLAAREALCGTVLLGAGVSTGLGWAVLAAVGYEAGARSIVLGRRKAALPRFEVAPEVVPG